MSFRSYLLSFLLIIILVNHVFAQKLYIWCPEEVIVQPHIGFLNNQEINLIVFDGRTIPQNSKVECKGQDIESALKTYIQTTYPSCKINLLQESMYYQPSARNMITIKIGIGAYQAGFGTDISVGIGSVGGKFSYAVFPQGKWNGLVSYFVQIYDDRAENKKKYSKEISEITTKSNLWGYKTAKSCLNTSYDNANLQLLSFIDGS